MSRIGKRPISIPDGVEVKQEDQKIIVKGTKGTLEQGLPSFVELEIKDNEIKVLVKQPNNKEQRSCWGTIAALIRNMIKGVKDGFEKKLELVGVGYRAELKGEDLVLNVGFSHPINFKIPEGIKANVEKNTIVIQGIDKQLVGEVAAKIRKFRKPEPYKGKGIKYSDEVVRRKAGKKVSATGS